MSRSSNPLNVRQIRICGPGLPHPDYAAMHDAAGACPACRDEELFDELYLAVSQARKRLALANRPEFDKILDALNNALEEYNPAVGRYDYEAARDAGENAEEPNAGDERA